MYTCFVQIVAHLCLVLSEASAGVGGRAAWLEQPGPTCHRQSTYVTASAMTHRNIREVNTG